LNSNLGDDLDRTTSGRFVRNLALSLSGGALLTLLGATAAHAQDSADATTDSAGTGAAHSGDANAVGNQSGTNNTQTVTVSGNLGTIQVINQQANVTNTGAAIANSGGNIAIGNSSDNGADATQTAGSGGGVAANNGQAANGSNGSATISTGNASAMGNHSSTNINQEAHGSAHGQLGGILVINQDATVTNSGVALANSGGNFARGNDSDNDAGLLQGTDVAGGVASNNGKATNDSDGKATISTGGASATGNKSDTQITQSASGSAGGELGGLVIIDQTSTVLNTGAAVANSGLNRAEGNTSNSAADVDQAIGTPVNPVFSPVGVASNNGEASNWSDGSANIATGAASAVGNDSSTTVTQHANADVQGDGGLTLVTQDSNVLNAGIALANSGGNLAVGNASDNGNPNAPGATVDQIAPSAGALDVGVIGNFGKASNESDGSGSVASGAASAAGNRSKTDVSQSAITNGGGLNLYTQGNNVTNVGLGLANSGINAGIGNTSENGAAVTQAADLPVNGVDVGVIGNFGKAGNSSDGSGSVSTGAASAVGNDSRTAITQEIDPNGLVIPTQVAGVVNAGVGVANSGGNLAVGNNSANTATIPTQTAGIGSGSAAPVNILAGTIVASNNGEASNASDGSASIATGAASATGNSSDTAISQHSEGTVDGLGLVLNTQVAGVANIGLGVANSGINVAVGNTSQSDATATQDAEVGSGNSGPTNILTGILTASNSGTASNASDGTANIATGAASATGNKSATRINQAESASVDGLGAVINTQAAGVANVGLGVANSGVNLAIGNDSNNGATLDQDALVGSNNANPGLGTTQIISGSITAGNSGEAENVSDGTADIATGSAQATGNSSATVIEQAEDGEVDGLGLVVNTQVGGVLNAGVGVANSGVNAAVGNASDQDGAEGARLSQDAEVGSNNPFGPTTVTAFGPIVANNSGQASNTSDGTGKIRTGAAQAQGNVSTTALLQSQDGTIDDMGAAINTQVGGVANVGLGVANSGVNVAAGNTSANTAEILPAVVNPQAPAGQNALIGSRNNGLPPVTVTALGAVAASNSGDASNSSDGTALVGTGGALASGNVSATNLTQHQTSEVEESGLIIGTQVGGVANVGLGIANSGINASVGNDSDNTATTAQNAEFVSGNGLVVPAPVVVGPLVANNSGEATNASDGEACVCTGNAVASGNVSSTTLIQDLDTSVGSGFVVLTEAGGVLNAGLGLANSGVNAAIGNTSDNTATTTQDSIINDALPLAGLVGPQVAHNGGGGNNVSDGTGKVGSGNATATGNQSTTNFVQAAAVDSDFAVATLAGGTTNTGLGLANSGLNLGVGNASTNTATLDQDADGAGIVSNDGTADNESDGSAIIGDPTCDVPVVPPVVTPPTGPKTPGVASLPKTGGPIEAEAAFALMLLLAGFGLRRKSNSMG
jgi:hypothetical protein